MFFEFFELLQKTEPLAEAYDVEWRGPYFIPRSGSWFPTHFMLYRGILYGSMETGWSQYAGQWKISTGEFFRDPTFGHFPAGTEDRELWERALPDLTRRLKSALKNPKAYNRRVNRLLPLSARTGRVLRRLTWPRGARSPLSPGETRRLEAAGHLGDSARPWAKLTVTSFLQTVARAYEAAFKELKPLAPLAKYKKKADNRHGGLLDIDPEDPQAFHDWFKSGIWSGTHPWEIVFGHPHGILFSPTLDSGNRWRFHLSADTPGLYLAAARMAIALGEAGVPFKFYNRGQVVAALRGLDFIPIGPHYGQMSLAEFQTIRPEALPHIRWDPIPEIRPITDEQRRCLEYVLRTGSPAGWK